MIIVSIVGFVICFPCLIYMVFYVDRNFRKEFLWKFFVIWDAVFTIVSLYFLAKYLQ